MCRENYWFETSVLWIPDLGCPLILLILPSHLSCFEKIRKFIPNMTLKKNTSAGLFWSQLENIVSLYPFTSWPVSCFFNNLLFFIATPVSNCNSCPTSCLQLQPVYLVFPDAGHSHTPSDSSCIQMYQLSDIFQLQRLLAAAVSSWFSKQFQHQL